MVDAENFTENAEEKITFVDRQMIFKLAMFQNYPLVIFHVAFFSRAISLVDLPTKKGDVP